MAATVRVRMKRQHDQLAKGQCYNLPQYEAQRLLRLGFAEPAIETKPIGPSEIKPTGPTEVKHSKKKLLTSTA